MIEGRGSIVAAIGDAPLVQRAAITSQVDPGVTEAVFEAYPELENSSETKIMVERSSASLAQSGVLAADRTDVEGNYVGLQLRESEDAGAQSSARGYRRGAATGGRRTIGEIHNRLTPTLLCGSKCSPGTLTHCHMLLPIRCDLPGIEMTLITR